MGRWLTAAVVLAGVLAAGGWWAELAGDPKPPAGLTVAVESHADSYDRAGFGQRWRDVDRTGCDQRNDTLARDLTAVVREGRCVVVAGEMVDPYTGERVTFAKARASEVQIDHVVALGEAWRSGAWAWTPDDREAFANDLGNLRATAGPVNQAKSDEDAAEWQPPSVRAWCWYGRQVIEVKTRYGLTVDAAEAKALRDLVGTCPE